MSQKAKSNKSSRAEDLRKDIPIVEHTWTTEKLLKHFNIESVAGLTSAQVQQQESQFGKNQLTPPKTIPAWLKFLHQFQNFFAILLLVGGVFCFTAYALSSDDDTNLYLGVVLMLVVFITATFSFLQEAKSEKIMEGFKNLIPKKCRVIRDGTTQVIDAVDLVPGDVVEMSDGDQVPADIRVIAATDLKVDNSSLTGESEPQTRVPDVEHGTDENGNPKFIPPIEAANLAFYTTIISSGSGRGIVVGTGDHTVMGQIAGLATETSAEASPISKEIKKFIQLISVIAISLGITFFVLGLVLGTNIVSNVVFTIGIIVANVPEGLLATVTVSLALTAKRMHSKNVLVKNLEAVETLGSTTVIASDKTGTLTQNRMTVQHCWYNGQIFRCPAARNVPQLNAALNAGTIGEEPVYSKEDPTFKALQTVASLCNSSNFILKDQHDENAKAIDLASSTARSDFNLLGLDCTSDASEAGLAKCFELLRHLEEYRAANPVLFEIKFNSTNKWALTIHRPENAEINPHPVLLLKGAPERVLKMCKNIMIDGKEVPLDADWETKYTTAYETLGGLGERVLGFAIKNMKEHSLNYPFSAKPNPNFAMDDLTFVGLISLIDPPREGVPEAVTRCKCARIKVFMVTGDHPITALAIAKQVGIIDQEKWDAGKAAVVKGDDIRGWMDMPDAAAQKAEWDKALSHEQIVWARVSPAHKLLIVENAQLRGEVVAVTGDGVNDAPALKKGDIGVAMGIAGKDVSKEAADMILMDDNFASIVNGVEEGRLIFDNLKKSIAYTLTSNIPEIAPFLLYITINLPLPLSTVLILCVDLGTDMIPAISLAYEQKESDIMDRPPRNAATDRLVNQRLISFAYLQIGVMQALAGFFTYMIILNDFGYTPGMLMGHGLSWEDRSIMCTVNDNLRPNECGYGCATPKKSFDGSSTLYGERNAVNLAFCEEGCQVPFPGTSDPFSEFTPDGFRGFTAGAEAVCGRTCSWYNGLSTEEKASYVEARSDDTSPLRYILTAEDEELFSTLCDETNFPDSPKYGFPNRGAFEGDDTAPVGSFYWWDGKRQLWPNTEFQINALQYAQTAYFVSIVVVQWADLLIAKTRKLSVFQQGLSNGFMNFGLVFETCLAILLVYTPPFNTVFGTRPIHFVHWFPGVPWSLLIFVYDELRKLCIRNNPGGWLDKFTYW
uniref:P-type ATPase n=1 Tax=Flabellia petiolata TaxID=189428 RepID=Q4LB56_9CHLO|nr:P-type ATPase [Flabellia petiolata]